jgi:cysteine desulfurase
MSFAACRRNLFTTASAVTAQIRYNSKTMTRIYLDHNATAPLLPEVAAAMAECYAAGHANPASQHFAGRRARQIVEDCREAIGRLLGADVDSLEADRLIFTSGGTEANNLALAGLCTAKLAGLAISTIEHPSIVGPAERMEQHGYRLQRLSVTPAGVADLEHLSEILRTPPQLLSLMLGNNETGVLQPVREIAEQCARAGVLLHTDAVQVVGKLPVDFRDLGVAAMSLSAHKFHGPVGIGALLVRQGVELSPLLVGGHQQSGLRPGTEAVALIVGLRTALECWHDEQSERLERMTGLRNQFEQQLRAECSEIVVHGADSPRLPHTSNVSFAGVERQALVMALDLAGIACSTGSACASGSSEPSPVLVAMGLPEGEISSALRFSLGARTTTAEVAESSTLISQIYKDLRDRQLARKTG